jgi:tetratricopeptide (TPR) repeat protein
MRPSVTDDDVRSLQRRAEQAIRAAKPREFIVRLLEQLASIAAVESEAARFAHRHLAELRLEESPWKAALHLRRVLSQDADDDVAQALMGLCQALQANFRCAVAAYRRAVSLSPSNPWYNHNLGHLLDVALGASREALPYLRRAHRLEPAQDEVAASLAHCLGRLGQREEGLEIARALVARHPHVPDHRALLRWLEQGASLTRDCTVPGLLSTVSPATAVARTAPSAPPSRAGTITAPGEEAEAEVERLLAHSLALSGRAPADMDRARSLWRDYARRAQPVQGRAAVLAAAVEYALARIDGLPLRQKDVAVRHGISIDSLKTRYAAMRMLLALTPNDPRYARTTPAARRGHDDEHR